MTAGTVNVFGRIHLLEGLYADPAAHAGQIAVKLPSAATGAYLLWRRLRRGRAA